MRLRTGRRWTGVLVVLALALIGSEARALKVGDTVAHVTIRDANNTPATIPDLGKKVLAIFYTDPDEKDQNEAFRELLKAAKLNESRYRGIGIGNLKDTWKPNFIIRKIIRGKIEKFKATILTDVDRTLRYKWNLGDCDDKDIVIVVGKDRKVKYFQNSKMSVSEQKQALQLIQELIK